ncbi:hypothetical protein NP233_g11907 [Leucocoprinus birnbaumii]|uniref:Calcineurin-like phosphoesterase domain-containing protein n=1 Tax=Leucocoprinus birnbaumii TaxID=56174 RepID=A0AAD5YQG7_9AGAR|nr:hypothetical protein NP233_g11907 [Leucocoprinus birnbaumii]
MRTKLIFSLLLTLHVPNGVHASLVDDIANAISQAVDCGSCHALLVPMKGLAELGNSVFSDTMAAVCKSIGTEDDDVCDGTLGELGPILAHDLRAISPFGRTATQLCNSVFGLCQQPAVIQMKFPVPRAPRTPKMWVSKGGQPIRVAHFSDSHVDREYTPGAEVECTKNICCRNYADKAGKPIQQPAGILASHNCDTSTGLAESMLRATSAQDVSFSIFTGDIIEGRSDTWLVNQTGVTAHLQQFDQEMRTLLDKPVFPVIGNHDTAPVNSFPRNTTSGASSQWVFDTQAAGWSEWLDTSETASVLHMSGSYSAVAPGTNLRIISLNTLYWYKANFWLFDSDTFQPDPNGILAFAAQQLQAAEDAGQRAWILGHMPPSSSDAFHDQSNYFDQIIQRYKNTIAVLLFGHTHKVTVCSRLRQKLLIIY